MEAGWSWNVAKEVEFILKAILFTIKTLLKNI